MSNVVEHPAPATGNHPVWCSPKHCTTTDGGVRIHEQEPVEWASREPGVSFGTRLFWAGDELAPWLQLEIHDPVIPHHGVTAFLQLDDARRLRNRISEHLDIAWQCATWCPNLDDNMITAATKSILESGVIQHGRAAEVVQAAVLGALEAAIDAARLTGSES